MKINLLIVTILISGSILLSGCISSSSDKGGDDENPLEGEEIWGVGLAYLDDTYDGEVWYTMISDSQDYGVIIVNNTGNETGTVSLEATSEGGSVSLETSSLNLAPGDMEPVMITYSGLVGGEVITVTAEMKDAPGIINATITIVCETYTTGDVGAKGDKVMVEYTLRDIGGNIIDSGTLPATVGERYVGPAQQLGYITGFYMGLLGMRKPGLNPLAGDGETKTIQVPPELAYGTDPDAHELGGEVLFFTLTLVGSI